MTVEEAISRFTDEINGEGFYNDNAHREMAIEALEKQIPKKPLTHTAEYDVTIGNGTFKKGTSVLRICPSCEGWVLYTHHTGFCGNCGQRLDWSEDE